MTQCARSRVVFLACGVLTVFYFSSRGFRSPQPENASKLPPYVKLEQRYFVSQQYQFTFCTTDDFLLDYTAGIACWLHNWKEFRRKNMALYYYNHSNSICQNDDSHFPPSKMTSLLRASKNSKWMNLIILQEPIYRFLRAYDSRCVNSLRNCFSCTTMTCVLNIILQRLANIAKGATPTPFDMEFVPQNW
ncbi:unnamed protein product [Bursaphelenchus xylophilus]|nr:unnamed protein product [Bursaphelenchus xylophilus]CAG9118159.1 unnamed protein product [Bursaphelenchus xylophilus]